MPNILDVSNNATFYMKYIFFLGFFFGWVGCVTGTSKLQSCDNICGEKYDMEVFKLGHSWNSFSYFLGNYFYMKVNK